MHIMLEFITYSRETSWFPLPPHPVRFSSFYSKKNKKMIFILFRYKYIGLYLYKYINKCI